MKLLGRRGLGPWYICGFIGLWYATGGTGIADGAITGAEGEAAWSWGVVILPMPAPGRG